MKKIIIILAIVLSIVVGFSAGHYHSEKEHMLERDQTCDTMLSFVIGRLEDIQKEYNADDISTVSSYIYVAQLNSNDAELSGALHRLWNAFIFDGDNVKGKEESLIKAIQYADSDEIERIAISMRTIHK